MEIERLISALESIAKSLSELVSGNCSINIDVDKNSLASKAIKYIDKQLRNIGGDLDAL